MARGAFDMTVTGDERIVRLFRDLPDKVQSKALRPAFRKSLIRLHNHVLVNLSGRVVRERTGAYVRAMEAEKPSVRVDRSRSLVVGVVRMPDRESLGIPRYKKDKGYYPAALEYGSKRGKRQWAGKRPIRDAINRHEVEEANRIAEEVIETISALVEKRT